MPGEVSFRVVWSRNARMALRGLKRTSRQPELSRVVHAVDSRLRREPRAFGEVYRGKGAIEEHLAIHEFLAVDFAVD